MNLGLLWDISDTFNGLMAVPNLIALLMLSGHVKKLAIEVDQAEKDGTARLNAVISGAQERMREAKRQAGKQAAAFETDLNSKTAAQCRALEQAAASRSGAAAAMIVERIWDSEWQS